MRTDNVQAEHTVLGVLINHHLFLLQQKLRDAGIDVPEAGKKGAGPQEENKNLKEEVKTLKEELEKTKKGEEEEEEVARGGR